MLISQGFKILLVNNLTEVIFFPFRSQDTLQRNIPIIPVLWEGKLKHRDIKCPMWGYRPRQKVLNCKSNRGVSVCFLRQETTLKKARQILTVLSVSCMSWKRAIYLFCEASFQSSVFCLQISKTTSPMNHFLIKDEDEIDLTWGICRLHRAPLSHHCALLSCRQLMVMRDRHLFFGVF